MKEANAMKGSSSAAALPAAGAPGAAAAEPLFVEGLPVRLITETAADGAGGADPADDRFAGSGSVTATGGPREEAAVAVVAGGEAAGDDLSTDLPEANAATVSAFGLPLAVLAVTFSIRGFSAADLAAMTGGAIRMGPASESDSAWVAVP